MKINGKGVRTCVCRKLSKEEKSFIGKIDLALGIAIVGIGIPVWIGLSQSLDPLIISTLIFLVVWLMLFVTRLFKGHSPKCAARWAIIWIFGSIGGEPFNLLISG